MPIENDKTGAGKATGSDTNAGQPSDKTGGGRQTDARQTSGRQTVEDDGDDESDDGSSGRHDRHLRQTKAERDKYKAKLTEAERKLAEIEAKEREALEAKDRAAGDFKSIEGRYQTEIRKRDEQIQALTSELESKKLGERRRSFVDAIMEEAKGGNRRVIEALLPTLDLENDAPEHFTPGDVKGAIKALRSAAPEIFATTNTNPIKPAPGGGNRPPDKTSPDYYRDLAKRLTTTGDDAYAKATGRVK